MKFFVCVKQVPDSEAKIKLASDGLTIDSTSMKWVMNPYDEYAVEEAVKLRDANPGSQVWVLTVGPKKRAGEVLRTALAMGGDEGILIDGPENLDPFSTAKALASAIQKEGDARLILSGKLAFDDNSSSVPQMLAELLNFPHTTVVSKLTVTPDSLVAERDIEGGAKEVVQLTGAAVVAANKGLNMPRYASLPGIMKAKKKVLKEYDLAALDVNPVGLTKILSMELPPEKPPAKLISGDAASQVAQLAKLLRDEAKVL
jgi:electron transfer flavoprotein beta subunit